MIDTICHKYTNSTFLSDCLMADGSPQRTIIIILGFIMFIFILIGLQADKWTNIIKGENRDNEKQNIQSNGDI